MDLVALTPKEIPALVEQLSVDLQRVQGLLHMTLNRTVKRAMTKPVAAVKSEKKAGPKKSAAGRPAIS